MYFSLATIYLIYSPQISGVFAFLIKEFGILSLILFGKSTKMRRKMHCFFFAHQELSEWHLVEKGQEDQLLFFCFLLPFSIGC